METQETAFKRELKELLTKYNATIACNTFGDTHGLTYEMCFYLSNNKDVKLTDGCEVDNDSIKL